MGYQPPPPPGTPLGDQHWLYNVPGLPPPPKPTPRPTWGVLGLCVIAGAVFVGGATYAARGPVGPPAPVTACVDALADAETMFSLAADTIKEVRRPVMDIPELEELAAAMTAARSEYDIDAAVCRIGGI